VERAQDLVKIQMPSVTFGFPKKLEITNINPNSSFICENFGSTVSNLKSHPLIRWLMIDSRGIVDPGKFLDGFASQLRAVGIEITRITTGVPILHPQLFSISGLWQLDNGPSERLYRAEADMSAHLRNSPILIVYEEGKSVRCRLNAPPSEGEFSILPDLRREGITDYIVLPARFSDGSNKALSLATNRLEGFYDDEIALFEAMMPAVSFALEMQTLRRTARTLLDTYVGRQAGGRVLDGQIRRGMGETIRAAIWLCDLRDFTSLSETLPREALIDMLNEYFGPMSDAVESNGGEVLKFIGDAMLGIFPITVDASAICIRALNATRMAQTLLHTQNETRREAGLPLIDYGIALHIGDVIYGNIGSNTRLDFTVIGPAVNLTARIEGLTKQLGQRVLMSTDFARASGTGVKPMGEFALKGVSEMQAIFAPQH
jgi:adenylate cyclase